MNDPVHANLSALFRGLDTRPQFNARLMERLNEEIAQEALRTDEARRLEQLRHRTAQTGLHPWKQALQRWVTLESIGISALAALMVSSAWSAEQIRAAVPIVFTAIGLTLAFAPVLGPLLRGRR
ncbi:MAG: hypothetical protein JSR66_02475 [Proteobacteria bacterium]|nr:hypothetical protein [Pseudomonadota bacterium]